MSNYRISELTGLNADSVASGDLLPIVDIDAVETKKIDISTLKAYILGSPEITGTIGTPAILASTASYINPTNVGLIPSASYSITSSYSFTSSRALSVVSASYVSASNVSGIIPTASYSYTASYVLYAGTDNGTVRTSISASLATNAQTASFVSNVAGISNGTASFSITASHAFNVLTSSFLYYTGSKVNGTASYAITASNVQTASFLSYDGTNFNGTASYGINSLTASYSKTASFLVYSSAISNGTASYSAAGLSSSYATRATTSDTATSASYAVITFASNIATSASYSTTSSFAISSSLAISSSQAVTSSLAFTASYFSISNTKSNIYNMFGPFTASNRTTVLAPLYTETRVTSSVPGNQLIILFAYGDVNVPLTSSAQSHTLALRAIDYDNPSSVYTFDTSRYEYVTSSGVGGVTSSFSLNGKAMLPQGRYNVFVTASNTGVTLSTSGRDINFYFYTKADSIVVVNTT
jgi:hypothetical protein